MQLSWRFASIPSALQELYSQNHNGRLQPTLEALLMIFKDLSSPFEHTYIVLDTLNKCMGTDWSKVLGLIETLVGLSLNNIHLLVTSQEEPENKHCLGLLRFDPLDLKTWISGDIQIYVCEMLANNKSFRHRRPEDKRLIEKTLMQSANGM